MARSVVGYVSLTSPAASVRRRAPASASGDDLKRQRVRVEKYSRSRRWHLEAIFEGEVAHRERQAGAQLSRGLQDAMAEIDQGPATGLLVDALARLSPYATDVGHLLDWLKRHSAILVAIDECLDTSKANGQPQADAFLRGAAWERAMTGARIRMGYARARGVSSEWCPPSHSARIIDRPEVVERIHALRNDGLTLRQIAKRLEDDGVKTARGGEWWPTTVASALRYPRPR
jgi:DNA invertase Pin-like site-specific DNA recombinase